MKPLRFTFKAHDHEKEDASAVVCSLRYGGETIATIQKHREGGFFWYGFGVNTNEKLLATLEECKKDCLAAARGKMESFLKAQTEQRPKLHCGSVVLQHDGEKTELFVSAFVFNATDRSHAIAMGIADVEKQRTKEDGWRCIYSDAMEIGRPILELASAQLADLVAAEGKANGA